MSIFIILLVVLVQTNSLQMPSTVKLSHRKNNLSSSDGIMPILFIHGLDSSSHTWRNILPEMQIPAAAIDVRGCGSSDLGDPDDFSPDSIVEDIQEFVSSHEFFCDDSNEEDRGDTKNGIRKFVICGHSMGGRIAMSYAAKYPQNVAALIIEDMDIRTRGHEMNMFQRKVLNRGETIAFQRHLKTDSVDDIVSLFDKEGYPKESVNKWIADGRIHLCSDEKNTKSLGYYSEVNPAFRILCYEQFFVTNHGEDTWSKIALNSSYPFPCHVMVAGSQGTVCDNESVWKMQKIMKEMSDFRMFIHRYKDATHSIHNSDRKKFLNDLNGIIYTAAAEVNRWRT
mmetsp:Transcript_4374/g.6415  ORF Transcript_4374/g.6415 Transcript_4374/m.6415 type:complete len:339 (-) Transcript_4374:124-1140(-)